MKLPATIGARAFDALHDEPARWAGVVAGIAAAYSGEPVTPAAEGTVLVGLVGGQLVVKLYPPFLRDHFDFECAVLQRVQRRLSVATPGYVGHGEREGWPYLVMTQLAGTPLTRVWPGLDEPARRALLRALGRLMAEVHALPSTGLEALAPPWPAFIAGQRAGCAARQLRTGLPAQLLAALPRFLEGPLPEGPAVILTGEYTPMNLLHGSGAPGGLAGMFDFGDGLIGPREYDWLGPLTFLAAGDAHRCAALFEGYGAAPDRALRLSLMRLLLLHRYSCLRAQLALPGWQLADDFETLTDLIWPD